MANFNNTSIQSLFSKLRGVKASSYERFTVVESLCSKFILKRCVYFVAIIYAARHFENVGFKDSTRDFVTVNSVKNL